MYAFEDFLLIYVQIFTFKNMCYKSEEFSFKIHTEAKGYDVRRCQVYYCLLITQVT